MKRSFVTREEEQWNKILSAVLKFKSKSEEYSRKLWEDKMTLMKEKWKDEKKDRALAQHERQIHIGIFNFLLSKLNE